MQVMILPNYVKTVTSNWQGQMHRVNCKRELPYSQEDLLSLASDVANYPKFLPWVKAVRIWNKKSDSFDAELMIGYKNFRIPVSYTHLDVYKRQYKNRAPADRRRGSPSANARLWRWMCKLSLLASGRS